MKIDFMHNDTVVATTNKLIDIDLSYYDNVFVSKPVAPEVRFTIAYNHLDNNDHFVNWWKTVTIGEIPEDIFAVIYDGMGDEIASGDLFEYDENLEEFTLEILIVPGFAQLKIEKNKTVSITKSFDRGSTVPYISSIFNEIFLKAWNKLDIPFSCTIEPPVNGLYACFQKSAEIIRNLAQTRLSHDKHAIILSCHLSGTKLDFLENLALSNFVNLYYSRRLNSFAVKRSSQGLQIDGFITGTSYSGGEKIAFTSVFNKIQIKNLAGAQVTDFAPFYKEIMQHQINKLSQPKSYNIRGYSANWLYPGDSIWLNSQKYTIREISYDPISLNSNNSINRFLKFFDAVCVKI